MPTPLLSRFFDLAELALVLHTWNARPYLCFTVFLHAVDICPGASVTLLTPCRFICRVPKSCPDPQVQNRTCYALVLVFCAVSLLQLASAVCQSSTESPHLSLTSPHVLVLMIPSTPCSCRINIASCVVLGSVGKNLAEYGSSLSLTTLSLFFSSSAPRTTASGSSGSGLVVTSAQ